jgi:ribulose-5-phosphate 4-epimerase/fuculose-1-phosphate aldolase
MRGSDKPARRRDFLKTLTLLSAGAGMTASIPGVFAQSAATNQTGTDLPELVEFKRLIAANRILANENVVDAFGHVSVRDPGNPERFVMSRSRSPALVEFSDLMEFDLLGNPLDARGRRPYGERMIHAAIYAARPEVQSVVHHHAYPVLPFTIIDEPLRPVVHAASIIGAEIPLGDNTCLLMRGHGAVVVGESIERAVLTAVYLQVNANVLMEAKSLGEPAYLSDEEIRLSTETQFSPLAVPRAWEYFCQRAGVDPV